MASNTNKALKRWPIIRNQCWSDSQVALCWIAQPFKNWKTFVSNRVKKIHEITESLKLDWRYVPTKMNHADFGSRGSSQTQLQKEEWWVGPNWIQDKEKWPKT